MSSIQANANRAICVALLRGINIGGRNKVDMKILKKTFEQVGMSSVITYINTGNVIFIDTNRTAAKIVFTLEQAILKKFGLQIKVLIRTFDDMKKVINALPQSWENNQELLSYVVFLWDEINTAVIVDKLNAKSGVDTIKYITGAVLWSINKEQFTKSAMMKLPSKKLYQQMTTRNVNSTRKIYALMQNLLEN